MKKYFRDISNLLSFSLALIPTLFLYIFKPSEKVPFSVFAVLLTVTLTLLWLTIKLALDLRYAKQKPTIRLLPCQDGFCLCQSNNILPQDSFVSFYQVSGNYEHLIGFGYVETVNSQDIAQIIPMSLTDDSVEDLYKKINDSVNSVVVRPTITRSTLSQIHGLISGGVLHESQ